MKNILILTDFSGNAWNALEYASSFYKNQECNFYLLNVVQISTLDAPEISIQNTPKSIETAFLRPAKEKMELLLQKVKQELAQKEHHFFTIVDHSFFIDTVRKHVDDKKIDFVVMGTKGASGLKEVILGTNAGEVITKVKCSTLIIPENAKYNPIQEVAFPTDFSLFYNIDTLLPLLKILHDTKASVRMLHINKKELDLNRDQQRNKELFEEFFAECNCSFHRLTNDKVEDAVQCFIESRDIDMIAMVAKNLNYFQQILFHTRVEKISYHTDVPLLVLHG